MAFSREGFCFHSLNGFNVACAHLWLAIEVRQVDASAAQLVHAVRCGSSVRDRICAWLPSTLSESCQFRSASLCLCAACARHGTARTLTVLWRSPSFCRRPSDRHAARAQRHTWWTAAQAWARRVQSTQREQDGGRREAPPTKKTRSGPPKTLWTISLSCFLSLSFPVVLFLFRLTLFSH